MQGLLSNISLLFNRLYLFNCHRCYHTYSHWWILEAAIKTSQAYTFSVIYYYQRHIFRHVFFIVYEGTSEEIRPLWDEEINEWNVEVPPRCQFDDGEQEVILPQSVVSEVSS